MVYIFSLCKNYNKPKQLDEEMQLQTNQNKLYYTVFKKINRAIIKTVNFDC
jgi:hypothetical protein